MNHVWKKLLQITVEIKMKILQHESQKCDKILLQLFMHKHICTKTFISLPVSNAQSLRAKKLNYKYSYFAEMLLIIITCYLRYPKFLRTLPLGHMMNFQAALSYIQHA
jgi:hypothetical protein